MVRAFFPIENMFSAGKTLVSSMCTYQVWKEEKNWADFAPSENNDQGTRTMSSKSFFFESNLF